MDDNPLQDMLNLLSSFLGFTSERFERFICWARYLHFADLHRRRYIAWGESKGQSDDWEASWELIALQSAFYASMWVVVEGWREVPLSDPSVDELLAANPQYLELLQRYRNSVFHYQSSFGEIHKRQMGLLADGKTAGPWLHLLHDEFCRVYWETVPRAELSPGPSARNDRYAHRAAELASEIRHCMLSLVGWIPSHIVSARAQKIRETCDAAMALLREAGDFESDEALQLLKVVRQAAAGTAEAENAYQGLKRETIERVRACAPAGRVRRTLTT